MENKIKEYIEQLKADNDIYELSISDINIDDYIPAVYDYYYDCFSIVNATNAIIQDFFTHNGYVKYSYVRFNNKTFGIILFNTVRRRLEFEHLMNDKFESEIDFDKYEFYFKCKFDLSERYKEIPYGRMTGNTTRLIDAYIHEMFIKPNTTVICCDDYGMTPDRYRGYHNISFTNPANRMIMDKIIRRIHNEFPQCMQDMIKINKSSLSITFVCENEKSKGVRYNKFE